MTYNEIKAAWNAQANKYNQWNDISEVEKVEWAFDYGADLSMATPDLMKVLKLIANAENSALDLAYCKGIARAAIANAQDDIQRAIQEDGWIQDGYLLYRLTNEPKPRNRDEISVTMVNGSRAEVARTKRASEILNAIRAAPDLLEALQEIVAAADGTGWNQLDPSLSKARAAIAKALGEK